MTSGRKLCERNLKNPQISTIHYSIRDQSMSESVSYLLLSNKMLVITFQNKSYYRMDTKGVIDAYFRAAII